METDKARGKGEGACFALVVRDGLLECPNCGGDHFTTLRVPQKNLFNSTLAQPGRTGLVLTGLPPFIVTALPTNSLLLPQLYCHCGPLRDAHTTYVHPLVHKHACTASRIANVHHTHMHTDIHTPAYTCTHANPKAYRREWNLL